MSLLEVRENTQKGEKGFMQLMCYGIVMKIYLLFIIDLYFNNRFGCLFGYELCYPEL